MKKNKLLFAIAMIAILTACSTPNESSKEDPEPEPKKETPASDNGNKGGDNGNSGSNGGKSNGNPEEPEEVINWVEVVADEESTSGFAYFFIDQRVTNPVADLVAEKKIKLVLVSTKSNIRADRYFGLKDDKAEKINVYKVFVNKDTVNEIFLTDNALVYNSAAIENDGFRFHITKNGNVWKMNIVVTTSLAENNGAIRYFNQYYE